MALRWYSTVIDGHDVTAQASWWDLAPHTTDDRAAEIERLLAA